MCVFYLFVKFSMDEKNSTFKSLQKILGRNSTYLHDTLNRYFIIQLLIVPPTVKSKNIKWILILIRFHLYNVWIFCVFRFINGSGNCLLSRIIANIIETVELVKILKMWIISLLFYDLVFLCVCLSDVRYQQQHRLELLGFDCSGFALIVT